MTYTLNVSQQLVVQDCCNCGIQFGVPAAFDKLRRDDHGTFYCPAGHGQSYTGKTAAQKAEERAAALAQQLEWASRRAANAQEDARAAHASLVATRGHLTRAKKRAAHGVCPCCSRTFANVALHVAGQHPEFVEAQS